MHLLRPLIFTALLASQIIHAMEPELDKIELGKQLAKAARKCDWKKVMALIDQKADLNQRDKYSWTALMMAAFENKRTVVKMLIDAGADVNLSGGYGLTPLMLAQNSEISLLLIHAGAQLDQRDYHGETALMLAIGQYPFKKAQILINAGADLNAKSNSGRTALIAAIYNPFDFSKPRRIILQAYLDRITLQKECIYTALMCFKRIFGWQRSNVRNLFEPIFKPMLKAMIQEVCQSLLNVISWRDDIKKEWEALCNRQQHQDRNPRCTIL